MPNMKGKILIGSTILIAVAVLVASENKPTFDLDYDTIIAEEGSTVEMECSAKGDLPITYEWNKNADQFDNDSWVIIREPSIDKQASVYIIHNVIPRFQGLYICTARNQHGLSSKTFELLVIPPSKNETNNGASYISKTEIANVTSSSVLFSIEIVGPAKGIEVEYNESRENIVRMTQWNYGDIYEVKDLIPGGSYKFRFRLVESDDKKWLIEQKVVLLPDKPDVIFYNLEGGNLKIGWNRKFDDIMRGTVDRYELTYYTVQMEGGVKWIPNKCAITIQIPSCAMSSYSLTGLSRNTFYEIQLKAHTESGYGEPFIQKISFWQL